MSYCLHCSVCENSYENRGDWLRHLAQLPEHQTKARKECWRKWGGDEELREVTIVVFCSFGLTCPGNVEGLLEHFGGRKRKMNQLVTDFVWWPEREKLAFMQFESREAVDRVMEGLEENSKAFIVGRKMVQLKRAVDFLELEWKELLPPDPNQNSISSKLGHPVDQTSHLTNGMTSRNMTFDEISGTIRLTKGSSSTPVSSVPPAPQCSSSSNFHSPTSVALTIPASSFIPEPKTPLQEQFNSICKSVEIPEDEFKHALEIISVIKQILIEHHPSVQVLMFRNYFLRLRNTGSNTLLLLTYLAENPADPNGFLPIGKTIQDSVFHNPKFHQQLPGFKKKTFDLCTLGGTPYQHEVSGFRFNFNTDPLALCEAHLDLLLQYMCSFDPRVKPLLTLIYFWAKGQDVHFAEKHILKYTIHSNSPEPVALEWLVMLYLIHEGIVPSVRQILDRPHKPLLILESKTDIGFSADPKYARKWLKSKGDSVPPVNSPEFLVSVITLLQKCFHFYSTNLQEGCWLLNPKDGEIIKREGTRCHKSKLSPEETHALTVLQDKIYTKEHLIISNHRIYMIHPLYITWRLSFCVETWTQTTCPNMWSTSQRLECYLRDLSSTKKGKVAKKKTLESVLAGGKQESEAVQLELQCEMNQSLRTAIRTRLEQRKKSKRSSEGERTENKKRRLL